MGEIEMSENEIWRDVKGFEGFYKVSNKGNLYSVERKDNMGRECGGRMLTPGYHRDGYLQVQLYKNGKGKAELIHRLVLEAFVENPNNLPEVNHLDEVKDNNELSNLEWCDGSYNSNYGTRNRRVAQTKSKKVRAVNIKTGEVLTFSSTVEAVNKGYSKGNISLACRGVYNTGGGNLYKGHRWYYEEGE